MPRVARQGSIARDSNSRKQNQRDIGTDKQVVSLKVWIVRTSREKPNLHLRLFAVRGRDKYC